MTVESLANVQESNLMPAASFTSLLRERLLLESEDHGGDTKGNPLHLTVYIGLRSLRRTDFNH